MQTTLSGPGTLGLKNKEEYVFEEGGHPHSEQLNLCRNTVNRGFSSYVKLWLNLAIGHLLKMSLKQLSVPKKSVVDSERNIVALLLCWVTSVFIRIHTEQTKAQIAANIAESNRIAAVARGVWLDAAPTQRRTNADSNL